MQVNAPGAPNTVLAALRNAAAATGSDFHYLLGIALRESSLKANAQSSTSSAGGLFQFLDQTWLGLVKTHGAKYGLGQLAGAISRAPDGRYRADSEADKDKILSLKKDPGISALMAGEYAQATRGTMETVLGRPVCGGELYAAHFLGAEGACKLIRTNASAPSLNAATLFPEAATANRSVFFHADGRPKSVREVYDWALDQPGPEKNGPTAAGAANVANAAAVSVDLETLARGVINWQPDFSGAQALSLSLNSGLLDLLSSSREA
ncbi:MAG: transglycosylase SLT domain-containing protein [Rhizomicrobium sp.]